MLRLSGAPVGGCGTSPVDLLIHTASVDPVEREREAVDGYTHRDGRNKVA